MWSPMLKVINTNEKDQNSFLSDQKATEFIGLSTDWSKTTNK